jgi:hypothetical protein
LLNPVHFGYIIWKWEKQKEWERYIGIYDEEENELYLDTASVVQLTNKKLTTITKGVNTVKIYTWSLPTDPELAARIRIRRIHLATISITTLNRHILYIINPISGTSDKGKS